MSYRPMPMLKINTCFPVTSRRYAVHNSPTFCLYVKNYNAPLIRLLGQRLLQIS